MFLYKEGLKDIFSSCQPEQNHLDRYSFELTGFGTVTPKIDVSVFRQGPCGSCLNICTPGLDLSEGPAWSSTTSASDSSWLTSSGVG